MNTHTGTQTRVLVLRHIQECMEPHRSVTALYSLAFQQDNGCRHTFMRHMFRADQALDICNRYAYAVKDAMIFHELPLRWCWIGGNNSEI